MSPYFAMMSPQWAVGGLWCHPKYGAVGDGVGAGWGESVRGGFGGWRAMFGRVAGNWTLFR